MHVQRMIRSLGGVVGMLSLVGCKDLTGSQPLPAGTPDPASYNTPAGALGMRTAALYTLEQELPQYLIDSGLLTDELESNLTGVIQTANVSSGSLDERILPEQSYGGSGTTADLDYTNLQGVRGQMTQALSALAAYDTGAIAVGNPAAMRGELYALEGYAEILLADFFCSGVPLSTFDFRKDFTYHASSTTLQVYMDAIAKADSAMTLAVGNDTILNLARVIKGRALLNVGQYPQAAQAVASVPSGFQYQLAVPGAGVNSTGCTPVVMSCLNDLATVSNREGTNGLPFLSSRDPRLTVDTTVAAGSQENGSPFIDLTVPTKYSTTASFSPFTVADWIEARLIQAEATLQSTPNVPNASAMELLNTLRAPYIAEDSLAPIPTSGLTWTQQVDTLMSERAAWMFLTGHRQGDLRRLLRQYGRQQDQVYPIGTYLAPGAGQYGGDVTAPIAATEYANPLFHGCLNRSA